MNLCLIVLSLILFNGNLIFGANNDELEAIDVLSTLKSSSPNCDLQVFVINKDDYKALTNDLTKLCSTSGPKQQCPILCNMVAYELKKACKLDKESRPSPLKYINTITAKEICALKNVQLTNQWILDAITNNGQKTIDATAKDLCTKVTKDEDTRQLARFFYKSAARVRQSDLSKTTTNDTKSNSTGQTFGESVSKAVQGAKNTFVDAATAFKDKTKEVLTGAKDTADETVDAVKDKAKETGEGLKNKAKETAEGVEDKAKDIKDKTSDDGEEMKKKAGETLENAKDKLVAGGKKLSKKMNETAKNLRDKAVETGDNIAQKTNEVISKGKGKVGQVLDKARDKGGAAIDSMKERVSGEGEAAKTKVDEDDDDDTVAAADKTKTKTNTDDDNDDDNADEGTNDTKKKNEGVVESGKKALSKIGDAAQEGLDKVKELGNKIMNKTANAINPTDEKSEKVLDVKQGKKPEATGDDEEDDDDNTNNKPKDDKQIQKPDEQKPKKPTDTKSQGGQDPEDDEDGEEKDPNDNPRIRPNDSNRNDQKNPANPIERTGLNRDGDDMKLTNTKDSKNYPSQSVKADPNKSKSRPKSPPGGKYNDDGWSGNFITYFLMFTLFVVVGYLVLHNKNKVLGLLIEGCRRNRSSSGRRNGSSSSSTRYQRLSQSS